MADLPHVLSHLPSLPIRSSAPGPVSRHAVGYVQGLRIGMLAFALCIAACSPKQQQASWELSGAEAQSTYAFLALQSAIADGSIAEAQKYLDMLLSHDAGIDAYRIGAEFYLLTEQWLNARTLTLEGLQRHPEDKTLSLVLSECYVQENRLSEATELLETLYKKMPADTDIAQELARLYLMARRFDDTVKLASRFSPKPLPPQLHYILAMALLGQDKLAAGEKELRNVVNKDPENVDAWINLATLLQRQKRHADAARVYRQALAVDEYNYSLWLRFVDFYIQSNKIDLARKVIAEAPESTPFQLQAANMLTEARHFTAARDVLLRLKKSPESPPEINVYLARLLLKEDSAQIQQAIDLLQQVPRTGAMGENTLRWQIDIMLSAGQGAEAMNVMRRTITEYPQVKAFRILAAQLAASLDRQEEGIFILQDALALWPDSDEIMYTLGSFFYAAGNAEQAMRMMEQTLAHNPNHAQALNNIGYTLAEQGRDLEKALAMLTKASQLEPEDTHILDSLAWALYQTGDYEGAWNTIRHCIKLGGNHAVIWEHYGDIAVKAGHLDQAAKAYKKALEADPENPGQIREKLGKLP